MALKCRCGKTLDDKRGAKGHVKFSSGGPHGEKMELPDDWESLFDDEAETDEPEDDTSDDEAEGEAGGSQADQSPTEPEESDSDDSGGSDGGRIKTALFEDVRALWGGHE